MRIQHNIMAMNAYRNYTNNVSAMKANLEKLSSGYKINRAGDDAAGLAISEKMRAQITGLETAQKNAKDGISLIQTAEGAMTEVHDMLNRMVELASQSANGTYDNTTDRAQMQKEVNQLLEEINRIADSSNFNGIKLLDGSMSSDAAKITGDARIINDVYTSGNAAELSGTKTFLDGEVPTQAEPTVFDVDFTGLTAKDTGAATGTKAVYESTEVTAGDVTQTAATNKITIGGQDIAVTATDTIDTVLTKLNNDATLNAVWTFTKDGTNIKAEAKAIGALGDTGTGIPTTALAAGMTEVTEGKGNTKAVYESTGATKLTTDGTLTINGQGVTITVATDDTLEKQLTTWMNDTTVKNAFSGYDLSLNDTKDGIVYTAKVGGEVKAGNTGATQPPAAAPGTATETTPGADDGVKAVYSLSDVAGKIDTAVNGANVLTVGGQAYAVTDGADLADQLQEWADAYNADAANADYTASVNDDGNKIVYTAKTAGAIGGEGPAAAPAGGTATTAGADAADAAPTVDFTFKIGGTEFTGANVADNGDATAIATSVKAALDAAAAADGSVTIDGNKYTYTQTGSKVTFTLADTPTEDNIAANFDWDVKGVGGDSFAGNHTAGVIVTTPGSVEKDAPLANTVFKLEANDIKDGTQITIDGTTVTLSVGKNSKFKDAANVVDLSFMEEGSVNLNQAISKISDGFKAGTTNFIVGVNDTSNGDTHPGLTVHKKATSNEQYDTKAKLAAVFSLTKPAGGGLKLQIGDTADTYNQLNVSIKDMHAASLGIAGVDISTQEGATAAVDAIKDAINTVSDVRGTLGATQNRLDHTINNLSVMTENIQDAESTIRDVDVAEEMMAYTKNNILIQSAQAMLAQANQVPQGVLQLLG